METCQQAIRTAALLKHNSRLHTNGHTYITTTCTSWAFLVPCTQDFHNTCTWCLLSHILAWTDRSPISWPLHRHLWVCFPALCLCRLFCVRADSPHPRELSKICDIPHFPPIFPFPSGIGTARCSDSLPLTQYCTLHHEYYEILGLEGVIEVDKVRMVEARQHLSLIYNKSLLLIADNVTLTNKFHGT